MRRAFLVALALPACSGREIPRGVTSIDVQIAPSDIQIPRADVPVEDAAMDGGAAVDALDDAGALDETADAATAAGDAPSTRDVFDAGSDADVPPPANRLCGFEEAQINAVAVKLATCFSLPPQQMMERLWRPETWEGGDVYTARVCDVFRLCVALSSTRGCSAVLSTCLKITLGPAPNNTCDGVTPSCVGVRLRTCAAGRLTEDSCQASMRECIATGGQGACAQAGAAPCSPGAPPRCDGDTLQRCVAGRWIAALDCGRDGARCDAAGDRCVGGGDACTGEGATCDGTTLVRWRGGRLHRVDCGLHVRGASCRTMGAQAFCGVGLECDPARAVSTGTCEGTNLALCAGGRTFRFDCAGTGFGTCSASGCAP